MLALIVLCVLLGRDIARPPMQVIEYCSWLRSQERLAALATLLFVVEGIGWCTYASFFFSHNPQVLQ